MRRLSPVLVLAIVFSGLGCADAPPPPPETGDTAPSFSLTDVQSNQKVSSDSLKGDVVLLNFWSTSCANCRKEMEELKAVQEEGKARVISIAIDGDVAEVKEIVDAKGLNYPVLSGNEDIFTQYDGYAVPYTIVLDRSLVVKKKIFGMMEKTEVDELITEISGS